MISLVRGPVYFLGTESEAVAEVEVECAPSSPIHHQDSEKKDL
jgi:hypothetical protein